MQQAGCVVGFNDLIVFYTNHYNLKCEVIKHYSIVIHVKDVKKSQNWINLKLINLIIVMQVHEFLSLTV